MFNFFLNSKSWDMEFILKSTLQTAKRFFSADMVIDLYNYFEILITLNNTFERNQISKMKILFSRCGYRFIQSWQLFLLNLVTLNNTFERNQIENRYHRN